MAHFAAGGVNKKFNTGGRFSLLLRMLGGGLASACFCAFFGGGGAEAAVCFISGSLGCALGGLFPSSEGALCSAARAFFIAAACGCISQLGCLLFSYMGICCSAAHVVAGSMITNVPGLRVFLALRKFFGGGHKKGARGLLSGMAASLAVSAGYALACSLIPAASGAGAGYCFALRCVFCAVGAAGFALMFSLGAAAAVAGSLLSALSYSVYCLLLPCGMFFSCLAASFASGIFSRALSAIFGCPADDFLIPALIPLLPGAPLFYSAFLLFGGAGGLSLSYAADAVIFYAAMLLGTCLSSWCSSFLRPRIAAYTRFSAAGRAAACGSCKKYKKRRKKGY